MCFIVAFFGDIYKDQGSKRHNNSPSSSSVLVKCAAIHFADTNLEKNLYQSCFFRISTSRSLPLSISLYIPTILHIPGLITSILFQTAPSLTIGSVISSPAPGASSLSQDLSAAGEPSPHSCGHGQDRGPLEHGHPRLINIDPGLNLHYILW